MTLSLRPAGLLGSGFDEVIDVVDFLHGAGSSVTSGIAGSGRTTFPARNVNLVLRCRPRIFTVLASYCRLDQVVLANQADRINSDLHQRNDTDRTVIITTSGTDPQPSPGVRLPAFVASGRRPCGGASFAKMVQARASLWSVAAVVAVALSLCHGVESAVPLQYDFYKTNGCPQAEIIVLETMKNLVNANTHDAASLPAILLRLHFHDCFVRGCDASVLLDVPNSEKTAPPNARLLGFEAVDVIKTELEKACPGVVSCADIVAFAARDSVGMALGPAYKVPAGRRDGSVSQASEAAQFLPDSQSKVPQLVANFANQGLSKEEMVVLSGAHTISEAACHHIDSRIYDYPANGGVDPELPADYAAKLKKKCRERNLQQRTFDLDVATSRKFDTQYYNNLVTYRGMLVSDQTLYTDDATTRALVDKYRQQAAFFDAFGKAMVKMGNIGVLTGADGQLRKSCRVLNQ